MAGYILRRGLEVIPTVLLVLTLVFLALRILPGDPAVAALGEYATPEAIATFRQKLGLEVIPTVLLVLTLVFLALRILPGDPAVAALGEYATPEAIATFRQKLGLDQPLWVQYF